MSNKQLYRIVVRIQCPICRKPVNYQITFYGIPLNQKKRQRIILDCPACKNKKVEMRLNINKKIEQLTKIIYNYTKTDTDNETGEIYLGNSSGSAAAVGAVAVTCER